jgi:hypothetical protein
MVTGVVSEGGLSPIPGAVNACSAAAETTTTTRAVRRTI